MTLNLTSTFLMTKAVVPHMPTGSAIVNLASQAAMYMGLVDNPLGPPMPTDLGAARQMLDILGMMQEKTHGNLTQDESVLLERILGDLRMQYVSMATTRR